MNSISGREAFRSLQELLLLPVGPSVTNPGLTCDDLYCSNNWTESRVVREEGFGKFFSSPILADFPQKKSYNQF